jgi:flagellar biosynthetic protein FliR
MITLASTEITSWVGAFIWPFVRISALIAAAPVFGATAIPNKVKLIFALVLTLVVMPVIPPPPVVEPISSEAFLITLHQILIGVSMGLALQMMFSMFVIGGQLIAYKMGLGFASMVDPSSGTQVPTVSQIYVVILTLVFLSINGHLIVIEVLVDSFKAMPVGTTGIDRDAMWSLVSWGSTMIAGGVKIALPAIASLFLINLTFAVVTRSAPQFNIFSLGIPVSILAGFFIMMITLPDVIMQVEPMMDSVYALIVRMLGLND